MLVWLLYVHKFTVELLSIRNTELYGPDISLTRKSIRPFDDQLAGLFYGCFLGTPKDGYPMLYFRPFSTCSQFWCIWNRQNLKSLSQNEKLLMMSNFFFWHNVFRICLIPFNNLESPTSTHQDSWKLREKTRNSDTKLKTLLKKQENCNVFISCLDEGKVWQEIVAICARLIRFLG